MLLPASAKVEVARLVDPPAARGPPNGRGVSPRWLADTAGSVAIMRGLAHPVEAPRSAMPSPPIASVVTAFCADHQAPRLAALTTPQLRDLHLQCIGRPTRSTNRPYLLWKLRRAVQGHVPLGPPAHPRFAEAELRVVTFRLDATAIAALDAAWTRHGYPSRMSFLRAATAQLLEAHGEAATAALIHGPAEQP